MEQQQEKHERHLLNKCYVDLMQQAEDCRGRREAVHLIHEADKVRMLLSQSSTQT